MYVYIFIYNRFIYYIEIYNLMLDRNKAHLVNNHLKQILGTLVKIDKLYSI